MGAKSANVTPLKKANPNSPGDTTLPTYINNSYIAEQDTKNFVDINNSLRVYIVYKNVLQDVLYCCTKNLKKKIGRLGMIKTIEETFLKENIPDMKLTFKSPDKEKLNEAEGLDTIKEKEE